VKESVLFLKEKNKTTLVFYFQIADKIFYLNKKNMPILLYDYKAVGLSSIVYNNPHGHYVIRTLWL